VLSLHFPLLSYLFTVTVLFRHIIFHKKKSGIFFTMAQFVQHVLPSALFGWLVQQASNNVFLSRQINPSTSQPANQQCFSLTPDQPSHQPPASRTRHSFSQMS